MRRALTMLLTASMLCLPALADAQTVVMRKQIAKLSKGGTGALPDPSPTPVQPQSPHSWVVGAWSDASACSNDSTGRRDVKCERSDGTSADDAACSGEKPAAERRGEVLVGCATKWTPGAWGDYASSCSDSTYRERPVSCQIEVPAGVNVTVEPSRCLTEKPAEREGPVASLSGCSYKWEATEWGDWSSHCSDASTRTRTVACGRSDGTTVDAAMCVDGKPPETETSAIHDACSYSLVGQFDDPKEFAFISNVGPMNRMSATRWRPGTYYYAGAYLDGGTMFLHPEEGGVKVGVSFTAPRPGTYRFKGRFVGAHVCGDGVGVTFHGRRQIAFHEDGAVSFDYERTMGSGEAETFMLDQNQNMSCDSTYMDLDVTQR